MNAVAVIASVLLGATFLLAGASKVAAGASWPQQARDLGAPSVVIPFVPWVEIVIGALLVAQLARTIVAIVAVVVLVTFTMLIVRRLAEGERPSCACFGAWSARPIGPGTVVRNLALIALGVITVAAS